MNRAERTEWVGLLLAVLLLASSGHADDADLRARAAEAFEAARAHTLKEPLAGRLDAVWHTDVLLRIRPDAQLQWWADVRRRRLVAHKTYRLVEPTAPLHPLPDDPGSGLDKWSVYMRAPFGTPPSTAIRYIADYLGPELASPEQGYILTHQLGVLEWAKEAGLELPEEFLNMKPVLVERITEEHAKDEVFSDLFAERIFFLATYANPSDEELERSVRVIVDAQVEPGIWAPPPVTLTYDGQSRFTEVEPEHARKMAMVALAAYLARADAGTDAGTGAGTDAGTGAGTGTGTGAGTGTGTGTGTGAGFLVLVGVLVLLLALAIRYLRRA